ncbi:hypothetical protein FH972_025817 [Carpinus fangiana]|uniref:Uncharacterized protein n=1 Tax=Carpinus fangiana TaxID=176857 RepID=A0A5N6L238_9ROSI|nr:hypothetical protein FH972_025817 [Carpinus fangiana]
MEFDLLSTAKGLVLPLAYLIILVGSLSTFSYLYRRRKAMQAASLQPWFPPHTSRNVYLTLLELQSSDEKNTKVPDSVLRAALLRRAVEDIQRLIQIRAQKPALTQLLQRGAVGDQLMQRFQFAEKEMEAELRDVVQEANALAPQQNWGQTIFQSAGEIAHTEAFKKKLDDIEATRADERERWEVKRKNVSEGFLKELDGVATKKPGSSDDEVLVESGGPDAPLGKGKKPAK